MFKLKSKNFYYKKVIISVFVAEPYLNKYMLRTYKFLKLNLLAVKGVCKDILNIGSIAIIIYLENTNTNKITIGLQDFKKNCYTNLY